MKIYHITVEMEDGWYCVRALEDSHLYTQGRTLDEAVYMLRDLAELLYGDEEPILELVLPPRVKTSPPRRRAKVIA